MSTTPKNNKTTVMTNTLFLYARMIVTIAVGLYASRIVLSVLGDTDFGIYSLVGGIVVLLSFLNSGMLQASQRFLSYALGRNEEDTINNTFWASWYAHLILAIAIIIIGEFIGLYLVNHILSIPADRMVAANWVYQCSLLTCAVSVLSIPYNSAIIAHEHMDFFAYVSILEAVLKLLIIYILLVISYDKLVLYAILMLAVQSLIRYIYIIYCNKKLPECKSHRTYNKEITRKILTFAGWSLLGNLGITCRDQGNNIILNLFFQTPVINAARGIATQVSGIISTFATNITMAINPQITKTYAAGNITESSSLVYMGCRVSFYMLTIISIPLAVNIDYVLSLWLEEVPTNTSLFMYFILGTALIYSMSQPITVAIQATGKIKKFQIWIFTLVIIEIALTTAVLWITESLIYALVPSLVMTAMSAAMRIIILKGLVSKYSYYTYTKDVVIRCCIVIIASYYVSTYLHDIISYNNFCIFLLECTLITIATTSIIWLLGLKTEERCYVKTKIQKRLHRKDKTQ